MQLHVCMVRTQWQIWLVADRTKCRACLAEICMGLSQVWQIVIACMPLHMLALRAWHAGFLRMPFDCVAGLVCGLFHVVTRPGLVQACTDVIIMGGNRCRGDTWAGLGGWPYPLHSVWACPSGSISSISYMCSAQNDFG